MRLLRPESCLGELEWGTAIPIADVGDGNSGFPAAPDIFPMTKTDNAGFYKRTRKRGVKIAAKPHTVINQIFPPTPLNFATKSDTCWKTVAFLVR